MYEKQRLIGLKGQNRLLELRAQKDDLKTKFQPVDTNQKEKQQRQHLVQGRIAEINEEIARLQVELHQLNPELDAVTTDLKADSKCKLQLYNQAKALDGNNHLLKEKEQILENEVEFGVQGFTEVDQSWVEYRGFLASIEKKAADVAIALVITNIISALVLLNR